MSGDDPLADNSRVSYTVKELFDKLGRQLENIDGKLDGKVGTADFATFKSQTEADFDDHDRRIGDLEASDMRRSGIREWQARTWVAIGGAGALLAAIAAALGIFLGGH